MDILTFDSARLEATQFPLGEAYKDPAYVAPDRRTPRYVIQKCGPIDLEPGDVVDVVGFCTATHDIIAPRDGGAVIMAGWSVLLGVPREDGTLDPKPVSATPVIRRYAGMNWDYWTHHFIIDYRARSRPLQSLALPNSYVYVTACFGWNPAGSAGIDTDNDPRVVLALPEMRVLVFRP